MRDDPRSAGAKARSSFRLHPSSLAFHGNANKVAPLGPRAVVDLHVLEAKQLREGKVEHGRAMTHAAVGDDVVPGPGPARYEQASQLRNRLERPVAVEQFLEIQVLGARNPPVTHRPDVGTA